jgi:hypothetical protein
MIHRKTGLGLMAVAAALFATKAQADCTMMPWSGSFEANPVIAVPQTIRKGGCFFSYGGGLNVTYESMSVTRRPRHMTISPGSNGFSLNVRVKGAYKGKDAYTIRLCGRNNLGRGCITLNYDVTII